jgi:hypothetical protein
MPINKTKRFVPRPRGIKVFPNSILVVNTRAPKLEQLFNAIYNKAYILKKYSTIYERRMPDFEDRFDVRTLWDPIKGMIKSNKIQASAWVQKLSEEEQEEILDNEEDDNELSYFLSQLVRIPKEKEPSLFHISRVALNLGQYKGMIEGTGTNHNPVFKFNNLYDFIDATNMAKLSKNITQSFIDNIIENLNSIDEYEKPVTRNRTSIRKTPFKANNTRSNRSKLFQRSKTNQKGKVNNNGRLIIPREHKNVSL